MVRRIAKYFNKAACAFFLAFPRILGVPRRGKPLLFLAPTLAFLQKKQGLEGQGGQKRTKKEGQVQIWKASCLKPTRLAALDFWTLFGPLGRKALALSFLSLFFFLENPCFLGVSLAFFFPKKATLTTHTPLIKGVEVHPLN